MHNAFARICGRIGSRRGVPHGLWAMLRRLQPSATAADRHLTYHLLLESAPLSECPLCHILHTDMPHRLETLLTELVNDPECRARNRQSLGLCAAHAQAALSLNHALGIALLYRDAALQASDRLRLRAAGVRLRPRAECPVCVQTRHYEAILVRSMAELLADKRLQVAYAAGAGLCVGHLEAVIAEAAAPVAKYLAETEGERLGMLADELTEYVRKQDWRYAQEVFGREADSPRRAIEKISGNCAQGNERWPTR